MTRIALCPDTSPSVVQYAILFSLPLTVHAHISHQHKNPFAVEAHIDHPLTRNIRIGSVFVRVPKYLGRPFDQTTTDTRLGQGITGAGCGSAP